MSTIKINPIKSRFFIIIIWFTPTKKDSQKAIFFILIKGDIILIIVYGIVIFVIIEYLIAIFKLSKDKLDSKIFLFIKLKNIPSNNIKTINNYCIFGCLINIFSLYLIYIDAVVFLLAVLVHCIILNKIYIKSKEHI